MITCQPGRNERNRFACMRIRGYDERRNNMSSIAILLLTIILCGNTAHGTADIGAFVKQYLTTTTCRGVRRIPEICDVDWKVKETDAEQYDSLIAMINMSISLNVLYSGLRANESKRCRRTYEKMVCRNTLPVCDEKRMVVDRGDGRARCEDARLACTSIAIEGCEFAARGVESILPEQNRCVNVTASASKLCPDVQLKVPKRYVQTADKGVEKLLKKAQLFSKELANIEITAECERGYREVLCRLIDSCSSDGFYYLHYINESECEKMISCVKSAGFSEEVTSICSGIPSTEDMETIRIPNHYVVPELPAVTSSTPLSTSSAGVGTVSTTERPSSVKSSERSVLATKGILQESLLKTNNTLANKGEKVGNARGNAPRNCQSLFILILFAVFSLCSCASLELL